MIRGQGRDVNMVFVVVVKCALLLWSLVRKNVKTKRNDEKCRQVHLLHWGDKRSSPARPESL